MFKTNAESDESTACVRFDCVEPECFHARQNEGFMVDAFKVRVPV